MANKKVHLICNAHIDPVWQWEWQEGISAAISTFQSAVDLSKEYDYIFCHNEVTLYKYIEEYAPKLFNEIRELIKEGKWCVMGGWYLQPDCTMPSGESFVRQILHGLDYFKSKFNVFPKVAINFDAFGHTVGLVQIVAKCGQTGYMAMRPKEAQLSLKENQFVWEGLDGSLIKFNRTTEYNNLLGESAEKIKSDISRQEENVISSLWGVGNHGGGPSRKDLQDIEQLIGKAAENGVEIVHSTPERFFEEIAPESVIKKSLYSVMPGCYISMSKLKRAHIKLENQLYFTEKICSVASMRKLMDYPSEKLNAVTEDLLNIEFHDILAGTVIQSGEENAFNILQHGLCEADRLKTKAFFALLSEEARAENGEYPVFVFNPNPYELNDNIECEFVLQNQNWSETEESEISVYDANGSKLLSQVIKEESNVNLDWRKRIIFNATLAPLALNRFSVKIDFSPKEIKPNCDLFLYEDKFKKVEIDPLTGLLKNFSVDGKEYLHDGFLPVMFDDNADPWAMGEDQLDRLGTNPEPFLHCSKPGGVFENLKSAEMVEDGPILRAVETFFELYNSKVRIEYRIYKNKPFIDVNVDVFWQDIDKLLRLEIPVNIDGKYIGQTAFGTDELFMNGKENVSQRFVAVKNGQQCLAIINDCLYASKYENGKIYLSLIRGAAYCTHPIPDRELVPENRFIKRIDQCEHHYSFRIAAVKENELDRMAMEFNQKPFAQNVFPVPSEIALENCKCEKDFIKIENSNITLNALKKSIDNKKYIIRLLNNQMNSDKAILKVGEKSIRLSFGRYEVKTVIYDNNNLYESNVLEI